MVINLTRKCQVASKVQKAQNPWQRMKGLLGRSSFPLGEALIIPCCQSIHMFFMKFPIDVVFCDRTNAVIGLCQNIQPFGLSPIFLKASYAIELPAGTIAATKTQLGDHFQI
jgi:uncharacterized membrane protein (UPF0127 family)